MARFVEKLPTDGLKEEYRDTIGNVADQVSDLVDCLDKEISVLQGKLSPVLTPSDDNDKLTAGVSEAVDHSGFYKHLQGVAHQLRLTLQHVVELTHRVEL